MKCDLRVGRAVVAVEAFVDENRMRPDFLNATARVRRVELDELR
jgi:hypothetical protein